MGDPPSAGSWPMAVKGMLLLMSAGGSGERKGLNILTIDLAS